MVSERKGKIMAKQEIELTGVSEFNKKEFSDIYERAYVEDRTAFLSTFGSTYRALEFNFHWNHYFLVKMKDSNIGLAYLTYGSDKKTCQSYIYLIFKHRKQGFGKKVKSELISKAFSYGFEKVETSVISTNISAVKLNESLGGVKEGLSKMHYWVDGYGHDIVLFAFFRPKISVLTTGLQEE